MADLRSPDRGRDPYQQRDLDLKAGDNEAYDSYGDTQGDAVLEGAVYGLFAAEDLVHPDGKTGWCTGKMIWLP